MSTNWLDWSGEQLGEYQLQELLGEGGVTAVFRGRNLLSDQTVIIKLLHPHLSPDEKRFRQWGHAAATLHHPHLAPILAYGWHQQTGYWVRPAYDGLSLAVLLQRLASRHSHITLADTLTLGQQAAAALDYLHHQNEIHGAIHPVNLWLIPLSDNDDTPWKLTVLDSGVWSLLAGRHPHLLTPFPSLWPYAAPEQTDGFTPSPATDLYNLAANLYHLITGQPPFITHSLDEARYHHQQVVPLPPANLRPQLSPKVTAILQKGLAKQPGHRLQSASHLLAALREVSKSKDTTGGESVQEWLTSHKMSAPPVAPSPAELIISHTGSPEQRISLDKPILTIGRSQKNDLPLPEQGVSRYHARIEWLGTGWHLLDLDSTNGVWMSQERLRPRQPYHWAANEPAQLGGFTLRWQPIDPNQQPLSIPPLPPPPSQEQDISAAERFRAVFPLAFGLATKDEGTMTESEPSHFGPPSSLLIRPGDEGQITERESTLFDPPSSLLVRTGDEGRITESESPLFGHPSTLLVTTGDEGWMPESEPSVPDFSPSLLPLIEPMTPVSPLPVPLVNLTLIPTMVEITPGQESFIQVLITNQGQMAERFYLQVEGLPPTWVSIPENRLVLEAGEQDVLQINLLNTLERAVEPGQRTFIVRVSPETAPDIVTVATGYVQIKENISFTATLTPEQVRPQQPCVVQIHNLGNIETTFALLARTSDNETPLQFTGQAERLRLAPGQQGSLPLTIWTSTRPLWGKPQTIPFRVQIKASHGDTQIKVGEIEIPPIMPLWVLLATGLFCLLITLFLLLLPQLL
ncbi:MAG: FHA domain-containing protein [Anaerolineae bacterium]|nr:FHA domain-containing protein [Anaerolineae bacterium]